MVTTSKGENHWHCWTCNRAGKKLINLYKQLNTGYDKIVELNNALGIVTKDINSLFLEHSNTKSTHLSLPPEYKSFLEAANTPDYRNALKYLRESRGFTNFDILKYHLGFCETGQYKHKIIIPSYNTSGSLNFFVGRDFYDSSFKHKNPNVSKDIIPMELYINWTLPIIICEGMFDAITIKRNAIPLLGKTIPDELRKRLIEKKVTDIYLALDLDALKQTLQIAKIFLDEGINVYIVDLDGKDPNEIGFERMIELIKQSTLLTYGELLKRKILYGL
jgi:DNA primase